MKLLIFVLLLIPVSAWSKSWSVEVKDLDSGEIRKFDEAALKKPIEISKASGKNQTAYVCVFKSDDKVAGLSCNQVDFANRSDTDAIVIHKPCFDRVILPLGLPDQLQKLIDIRTDLANNSPSFNYYNAHSKKIYTITINCPF